MGLIAEFDIQCAALPLVSVVEAVPDSSVILEFQYNHGRRPLFIATVTGDSRSRFEAELDEADDVGEWALIGRADTTRRYKLEPALSLEAQLGEHINDLDNLEALATTAAIIERIKVHQEGWNQTGWFKDHGVFDQFASFWQSNAEFKLHRLTHDGESEPPGEGLTDQQQEALRTAFEAGYFEIPRRASLETISNELGISASALSERLRRAQTQLIQETAAPTWPPVPK